MDAGDTADLAGLVAWGGFGLAFIFGYVANKTHFCTMGAVSDVVHMGDWGRMRAWLLAIAVAMLGTSVLAHFGYLNLADTIYTGGPLRWFAALVGGLCFGVGMTLAGGCGQKTLVRVGGGNLKSIVVFMFLGYSALLTLRGIFGWFRVNVLEAPIFVAHIDGMQTLPELLGLGMAAHWPLALAIAGGILLFVFKDAEFRSQRENIFAGVAVGLVVVAAWYLTGHIGFAENPETMEATYLGTNSHRAESMTFVAPIGYTMDLWAYWTDASTKVTFGIASVFGLGIGSFAYAFIHRTFQWEYFTSPQDLFRHIIGATLMGFGGVTAMGCTIGQGVTGISTLALGSFIAFFGILAGAVITMKVQYQLMMREG